MGKAATAEKKTQKPAIKNKMTLTAKPVVVEPKPEIEEVGPVCAHRWRIESPNGETSHGVCRACGAERDFPTAAEDGLWERNVPQSRWTGRTEWSPADRGF
jgi:hypothetical protein